MEHCTVTREMAERRRASWSVKCQSCRMCLVSVGLLLLSTLGFPADSPMTEEPLKQALFEKVFGSRARFEGQMRKTVLESPPGKRHCLNKLRSAWLDNRVSRKLAASDETLAYYLRLVADRLVHKFGLLEVAGKRPFPWADFLEARSRGDFSGMASLLRREFGMPDRVQTYLEWSTELRKPGP